jgi:DNA-binding XRE family transcriptional regulator
MTQEELGKVVLSSRKTVGRWETGAATPSPAAAVQIVTLVHPRDPELARAMAADMGETLEALGVVAPPPPPAPAAPPATSAAPLPARDARSTAFLVDAVVCAAADAIDAAPKAMRPVVVAAFSRAKAADLSFDDVLGVLAPPAPLPPPKSLKKR